MSVQKYVPNKKPTIHGLCFYATNQWTTNLHRNHVQRKQIARDFSILCAIEFQYLQLILLVWYFLFFRFYTAVALPFYTISCSRWKVGMVYCWFYMFHLFFYLSKSLSKQKKVIQIFIMFVEKCLFTLTMLREWENKTGKLREKHTQMQGCYSE